METKQKSDESKQFNDTLKRMLSTPPKHDPKKEEKKPVDSWFFISV